MPLHELTEPGLRKAFMGGTLGAGGVWRPTPKEKAVEYRKGIDDLGETSLADKYEKPPPDLLLSKNNSDVRLRMVKEGKSSGDWKERLKTFPEKFRAVERKALDRAMEMSSLRDIEALEHLHPSVKLLIRDYWRNEDKLNLIFEAARNVPFYPTQSTYNPRYKPPTPTKPFPKPPPPAAPAPPKPTEHQQFMSLLYDVVGEPTKTPTAKELAAKAAKDIAAIHKRQGTKPGNFKKLVMM